MKISNTLNYSTDIRELDKLGFISTGSFDSNNILHDNYQNAYYLSDTFEFTLYCTKNTIVNDEILKKVIVKRSPYKGKAGLLFYLFLNITDVCKNSAIIIEPSVFNLIGLLLKLFFNKKWIIDIWDIPFRNLEDKWILKAKRKVQVFFFKHIFKLADLYIVSMYPFLELREFELKESKCLYLKNGIPLEKIPRKEKQIKFTDKTVLIQKSNFFAPLYNNFGLNLTLEVLKNVNKHLKCNLIIVGQVNEVLNSLIDSYRKEIDIKVTGFINLETCMEMEMQSHIILIPHEKYDDLEQIYPIKAIESLALGKAIVYTDVLGLREIIADAGVCVSDISSESISECIAGLLDKPYEITKYEEKAIKRAEMYDAKFKYNQIKKQINSLLKIEG